MWERIKLEPSRFALHLAVLLIVAMWTLPTAGLLVSSLRDKNLIATSGWWTALTTTVRSAQARTGEAAVQVEQDGKFVISGNLFDGAEAGSGTMSPHSARGWQSLTSSLPAPPPAMTMDRTLTVNGDGAYSYTSPVKFEDGRGQRVFYMTAVPPKFTTENYSNVLFSQGIGRAFVNSLTVTIPATIIPILIAAFAAYALAWMKISGARLHDLGHRRACWSCRCRCR
jgi:alpha-glucoside transport system permease protein